MKNILSAFGVLSITLMFLPAPIANAATLPLTYTFNSSGTLYQASSAGNSTSPYFWLARGAKLIVQGGVGETIQGALPNNDPWYATYAKSASADFGAHPQNVFLLLSQNVLQSSDTQVYLDRIADNFTNPANKEPYNGEMILANYADSNNYYYAGIRDDGKVVIKKKENGAFTTLAIANLFSGTYNQNTNPDLIPLNEWIGLKLDVAYNGDTPTLTLSTDVGETGTWKLALTAADHTSPLTNTGRVGIESDYADAKLANFVLSDPGGGSSGGGGSTTSYDATVLNDKPVAYLTMASSSSGTEIDQTGNGHDGAYEGGTPTPAILPNGDSAADFNGSSEYLTVPSSPTFSIPTTGELTWEGWVRADTFNFPNASDDGYVTWMGKCEEYSPTCEWEARMYGADTPQNRDERLSAYVFNPSAGLGSGADWQPLAGLFQPGQWLYVVAEYQTKTTPSACSSQYPGTINIWVNGIEQNFDDHAPTGCISQYKVTPKAGDSPLDIGTMAMDTWFEGAVGKVAIYNYLLSQDQINAHYEAMTGATPSGSCGVDCTIPQPTP